MIISHAHRFVFVKTRKTAGTSLQKYLQTLCNKKTDIVTGIGQKEGKNWNYSDSPFYHPSKPNKGDGHIALKDILERAPEVKDYYRFTIERNPWDKTVSMWYFLNKGHNKGMAFSRVVRTDKWLPLDWDKYTLDGEIAVDDVFLYERLEKDFPVLAEKIGAELNYETFSRIRLKSLYRPEEDDYRTHFSTKMRDMVRDKFHREIEAFGYEF